MRIAVCMKQVPGVSEGSMDPRTGVLIRTGLSAVTNLYDRRFGSKSSREAGFMCLPWGPGRPKRYFGRLMPWGRIMGT